MSDDTASLPIDSPVHDGYAFDDRYAGEDPYLDFLADEVVYTPFDWDALDPDLVHRHDALVEADVDTLEALDPEPLPDLLRWAAARAWRQHGRLEDFVALCTRILKTPTDDRSSHLSYPDVRLEYASAQAALGRIPAAWAALDLYAAAPDADAVEFASRKGLLMVQFDDPEQGIQLLIEAVEAFTQDAPELAFDLTEGLLQLDRNDLARRLLAAAALHAKASNEHGLAEDLRAALSTLPKTETGSDNAEADAPDADPAPEAQ